MAKTKTPLLSLGSRGTIGNVLTTQKRGSETLVRRKPVPTDPKSEAQLAQRQKYRDAVAVWNGLSKEEKEAWRGLCPGLTAYQCFMRTELKYVPAPPPPEEKTEEQTEHSYDNWLSSFGLKRSGQRLTIANRKVTKLGFYLYRYGSPTGDITFTIRKVSDDSLINSKVWGDAADIDTVMAWYEVAFDTPVTIDEEVRIQAEFSGGSQYHRIGYRFKSTDVKASEYLTEMKSVFYTDSTSWDGTYRYKYYDA